jgi:uncharacterized protein (TIGR02217 family)
MAFHDVRFPASLSLGSVGGPERRSFQLLKAYVSGSVRYERPIAKPVLDSVRAGVGNIEMFAGEGYVVDHATGVVTFDTAPAPGATVTAGFEFDVPVRFDTDRIAVSVSSFQAGDLPRVPVVEVRI